MDRNHTSTEGLDEEIVADTLASINRVLRIAGNAELGFEEPQGFVALKRKQVALLVKRQLTDGEVANLISSHPVAKKFFEGILKNNQFGAVTMALDAQKIFDIDAALITPLLESFSKLFAEMNNALTSSLTSVKNDKEKEIILNSEKSFYDLIHTLFGTLNESSTKEYFGVLTHGIEELAGAIRSMNREGKPRQFFSRIKVDGTHYIEPIFKSANPIAIEAALKVLSSDLDVEETVIYHKTSNIYSYLKAGGVTIQELRDLLVYYSTQDALNYMKVLTQTYSRDDDPESWPTREGSKMIRNVVIAFRKDPYAYFDRLRVGESDQERIATLKDLNYVAELHNEFPSFDVNDIEELFNAIEVGLKRLSLSMSSVDLLKQILAVKFTVEYIWRIDAFLREAAADDVALFVAELPNAKPDSEPGFLESLRLRGLLISQKDPIGEDFEFLSSLIRTGGFSCASFEWVVTNYKTLTAIFPASEYHTLLKNRKIDFVREHYFAHVRSIGVIDTEGLATAVELSKISSPHLQKTAIDLFNQKKAGKINDDVFSYYDSLLFSGRAHIYERLSAFFGQTNHDVQQTQKLESFVSEADRRYKELGQLSPTFVDKKTPIEDSIPVLHMIGCYLELSTVVDVDAVDTYIENYKQGGREIADSYLRGVLNNAHYCARSEPAPQEMRDSDDYFYILKYVYPKGEYSDYPDNIACGDATEHLAAYTFDTNGYEGKLTGLLGYRIKEGAQENLALLHSYTERIKKISEFVAGREPNNQNLVKDFDEKLSTIERATALPEYRSLSLSREGKIIAVLSSASQRVEAGEAVNSDVLDLLVLYKYVFIESFQAYEQRSSDVVLRIDDEVSHRYGLWYELSSLYGENMKHELRNSIFEKAQSVGDISTLDAVFARNFELDESEMGFSLTKPQRSELETLVDAVAENPERITAVIEKTFEYASAKISFKGVTRDTILTDIRTRIERYMTRLSGDPASLWGNYLSLLKKCFPVNPKEIANIDNFFVNENIPAEKRVELVTQYVDKAVRKNITFEAEDAVPFKAEIDALTAALRRDIILEDALECLDEALKIRSRYKYNIYGKIQTLVITDIDAISKEISQYEAITEVEDHSKDIIGGGEHDVSNRPSVEKSMKWRNVRTFFAKTQESANARMGAYLCISKDKSMWENKDYFEAVMYDEETNKCVGVTMLLTIRARDGKKYLWFGPNPFEGFLAKVSSKMCYDYMYEIAKEFAEANGFDGIVVPSQESKILGECTNRGGDFPKLIKDSRLKDNRGKIKIVEFGEKHNLSRDYTYSNGALIWERARA